MRRSSFWLNFFMVIIGIVTGTLIANLTSSVSYLSWLSYSVGFGTTSPLAMDLTIIDFSLSLTLNISVAVIIFVIIFLVLGNLIVRKKWKT